MIEFLAVILGIAGIGAMVFTGFILHEERKLLRQIRKFAALYPPYPTTIDEEDVDRTSVKLEDEWNEKIPGRD